ncbi:MAG: TylF/MycF/NovP-related O-methyltransferase [Ignavibacteriaceae bacterium]|jgi:O-methyltransferase
MKKTDHQFALNLLEERKAILNIIRSTNLTQLDVKIPHHQIIPWATYCPWEGNEEFLTIYNIIKEFSLVDIYRCYELWQLIRQTNNLALPIIEIGVWRGGTGAILAKAAEKESVSKVYLCDTFAGVVKAGCSDTNYKGGEHSNTSVKIVNKLFKKLSISNSVIVKGIFPEESSKIIKNKIFRFCHIDVDTYDSSKDIFEFIWPKICIGGLVVFDDYGFWGCEGVTKYVNSLQLSNGILIYNLNGHALIIKTK